MSDTKKVWVVDDDPIAVTIMKHLLAQHPHLELSETFEGAEKLLTTLKSNPKSLPSLIILDLNMPLMSGWEVLDQLSNDFGDQRIPVAVFTSSIDERDEIRSKSYSEVIGHFVKPMTAQLLDEICEKLSAHR